MWPILHGHLCRQKTATSINIDWRGAHGLDLKPLYGAQIWNLWTPRLDCQQFWPAGVLQTLHHELQTKGYIAEFRDTDASACSGGGDAIAILRTRIWVCPDKADI